VLAFRREGYRRTDFDARDIGSCLVFPGFWRMAAKNWRSGLGEFHRSFSKAAFVRALQRLVPEVRDEDLVPGGSGVRAQALTREGTLADDFQFVPSDRMLHVLNVPSPAATGLPGDRSLHREHAADRLHGNSREARLVKSDRCQISADTRDAARPNLLVGLGGRARRADPNDSTEWGIGAPTQSLRKRKT
jgi:L-2-hydroxyglutarate oxidase LhgO